MKKAEFIKRRGEAAWAERLKQNRAWSDAHPDYIRAVGREHNRKGGKYYERRKLYQTTGIAGEKGTIRARHGIQWRPYKHIIAPNSQLHHNWVPNSAEYTGLALVETDAHRHGFIDVIEILEGEIKVFTEKEIANRGEL